MCQQYSVLAMLGYNAIPGKQCFVLGALAPDVNLAGPHHWQGVRQLPCLGIPDVPSQRAFGGFII